MHGGHRSTAAQKAARALAIALAAGITLSGCATHPAGTDLFGRPISSSTPPRSTDGRTVNDGAPVDLLEGISLHTPGPSPALAAASVTTDARQVSAQDYIVQPGDTLRGVGNRSGAGAEAIAAANGLAAPFPLRVGQHLAIPAGRYHEVRAGETGIAIARAYGVSWSQIVADNALTEPFGLRVGQRLRLPPGVNPAPRPATGASTAATASPAATPPTLEQQAQAFTLDIDDIMTGARPATASGRATSPAATARVASTGPAGATGAAAAGNLRFSWPLQGSIIQRFGPAGNGRVNDGIDIATGLGVPVRASADGLVVYAGSEVGLFGGLVLIDHGNGFVSAYGHLNQVAVASGSRVARGAIIATAGESGQVQSPQLHFEIRQNRRPVDPLRFLPAPR